jgi:hypothetical protein
LQHQNHAPDVFVPDVPVAADVDFRLGLRQRRLVDEIGQYLLVWNDRFLRLS